MRKKIINVYDYYDANGQIAFQTIRFEPKSFAQRRVSNGTFVWGLNEGWYAPSHDGYTLLHNNTSDPHQKPNIDAVWFNTQETCLYRLPQILQGIKDKKTIYICEGEKDADNLINLGLIATTSPMGAGKWKKSYTDALKDAPQIVIIADNDKPGLKHAAMVAREIFANNISLKLLILPQRDSSPVKDFTDWKIAGGTKTELERLVKDCPIWEPSQEVEQNANDLEQTKEYSYIIQKHGQPYYVNESHVVTSINESFWAGLHFTEHIEVYEPNERSFYRYDHKSGLYIQLTEDIIKQEISTRILDVSRKNNKPSLEKKRSNATLNNIIGQLRGISERKGCFSKKANPYVHLANGVIVFKESSTADFVEFSPELFSRNQSPIAFDVEANCPRFLNELLYPAVSSEDALLIQKYAGLCLLGSNLIQRFLILDGLAGRGKSQLALVIQNLIGLNNVTQLRTNLLHERFEIFRFLKKTLLIGVDVPGTFLAERGAHVIKGLVGGDWMDAEQKGNSNNFQIQGNFCLIITSNSRLQIKLDGDLSAWKRRLIIVRFEAPPPKKKIPDFAQHLIKEEGPGILNWALEGLKHLLNDIDTIGDIAMSKKQAGIVEALMAESDSLRHFLKNCVLKDQNSDLTIQEIIERYSEYCPAKGWHAKPITVIHRELESLMLELFQTSKSGSISRNEKNAKGFRKVCFKDEEEIVCS